MCHLLSSGRQDIDGRGGGGDGIKHLTGRELELRPDRVGGDRNPIACGDVRATEEDLGGSIGYQDELTARTGRVESRSRRADCDLCAYDSHVTPPQLPV